MPTINAELPKSCSPVGQKLKCREKMAPLTITGAASLIHVFLLIENRVLRVALSRLLRKYSDILVIGQGGQPNLNPVPALDQQCDVLIIDSAEVQRLQASIAFESIGQTACKTILIGMGSDEEQFIAAVCSGVTGYLLQDASSSDVVAAVRAVFRGEVVCPSKLCSTLFRFVVRRARETRLQNSAPKPYLTLRQQQLVALVARGLTNKEIASLLNLSEFTVRNHIHRMLRRVDASSRREAVEVIRAYGYTISP
jgi:DNA-binding NarL/FixJ family response regulator